MVGLLPGNLTLSELYYDVLGYIFALIIILVILLFIVRKKADVEFWRKVAKFTKNKNKQIFKTLLIILLILVVIYSGTRYAIYALDKSTSIEIDEKIMIIELDDYWNMEDVEYYEKYGYTLDKFIPVTDIISKYGFKATLGVTPYIFDESTKENMHISGDQEMIDYLKSLLEEGYELGMHGYNHCRNEYHCPKYEEVWFNVYNGKRELETIFNMQFTSYFPPGNHWTTEQYENVRKAGFKLIGNTHVSKPYFDSDVIITPRGYDPIYVYGWHSINFLHTPYEEWIDEYEEDNLFILQLHPNTFDTQAKLDDLDLFLQHVKNDGAKVMTYKEFYDYISQKKKDKGIQFSTKGNIKQ